jgi:hypothetical protein
MVIKIIFLIGDSKNNRVFDKCELKTAKSGARIVPGEKTKKGHPVRRGALGKTDFT